MLSLRISHLVGFACLLLCSPEVKAHASPQQARNQAANRPQRKAPQAQQKARAAKQKAGKQQPKKKRPGAAEEPSVREPAPNPLLDARPLSSKQLLNMFDANRNKRLDPIEQLAANKEVHRRKTAMHHLLRDYDTDKNGAIGPVEGRAIAAKVAAEQRKQTEAEYDRDRNGRLGPEERAAMLRDLDRKRVAVKNGEAVAPGSPQAIARDAKAKRAKVIAETALFVRFDADKNGKHSPSEAQAMAQFLQQRRIAEARSARDKASEGQTRPGADVLGPDELKPLPLPPKISEPQRQLLKRFDLDGDKRFNAAERQAISDFYDRRKAAGKGTDQTGPAPKVRPEARRQGKRPAAKGNAGAPPKKAPNSKPNG